MEKSLYLIDAVLTGNPWNDQYLIIAENKHAANQKLLNRFPGSRIRKTTKLNDNEITECRGPAKCRALGYGHETLNVQISIG